MTSSSSSSSSSVTIVDAVHFSPRKNSWKFTPHMIRPWHHIMISYPWVRGHQRHRCETALGEPWNNDVTALRKTKFRRNSDSSLAICVSVRITENSMKIREKFTSVADFGPSVISPDFSGRRGLTWTCICPIFSVKPKLWTKNELR